MDTPSSAAIGVSRLAGRYSAVSRPNTPIASENTAIQAGEVGTASSGPASARGSQLQLLISHFSWGIGSARSLGTGFWMIYDAQSRIFDQNPSMSTQDPFALSSELISELLTGIRLRGVQYRRIQAMAPFGLDFVASPGHAYFHFLAVGSAALRTADGGLHPLSAGNAVFLPQGSRHQLLSGPDVATQDIGSLDAIPLGEAVGAVVACSGTGTGTGSDTGSGTVLFHGCMQFDLGGMQGLGRLMPEVMRVDATGQRYPDLMPILAAMQREVCAARIGFSGILARLADAVAAMIVRGWVECGCDNASGLVAALRDPRLARAILALHRQPGRDWTVADLAAQCHTSRSVFAERFQATLGTPPLRYATELRMRLANQWLVEDRLPIETVAQRLGYTSQAAFSRAFKRVIGQPPGASRNGGVHAVA
ncbi:AraC family transcriptional regulator [Luteimonas sp. S4-F44]|uniref:AraC family transcriptional regulator n=1 Tax=Luteimonas sp. S4-F44 TaxID=2925842 RepID=UPI001F53993E|nr:AraC family transcriptional regulator [Luteimonas sp. S4-F44]UNK41299.1 AraC family transcriptional regulator [Luteimonas sp. S4-F44]